MWNRKKPIRTYQRKTAKKPFVSSTVPSLISIEKSCNNPAENKNYFDKNELCNNSLNYDPFETTFDRIARETVVPLLPLDSNINQNASWNSSSDSDINNASVLKSPEHITSDFFTCNNKSKLTHANVTRKCRRPQRDLSEVVVLNKIVPKRTKVTSIKNELQSINIQRRKRQTDKTKRKKKQSKLKKSTNCSEQIFHMDSNTKSNLKDTVCKNGDLWDNEHLSILKVGKMTTLQGGIITDFKYTSNCHGNIKPCFVKLNDRIVQNWYTLNQQKTVEDKRNVTCDLSYTNTLQANKENISKTHNIVSQSIAAKYNNVDAEHVPIKQCSVMLCDCVVKNCCASKIRTNDFIDVRTNLNVSHLPDTVSHCNNSITLHGMKKRKGELVKESFVKVERLEIEEFVKKSDAIFNEKERYIVSSTPISKHAKSLACSVMISPINTLHSEDKCLITTATKDISNIATFDKLSDRKMSSLIKKPKSCEFDTVDMQEEMQVLLSFSKLPKTASVSVIETEATSFEHLQKLTQKHNTKGNETKSLHLDISAAVSDGSRSLFGDTIYSHNYTIENITKSNMKKEHLTDALTCMSVEADMLHSFVDLNLEQKQSLNHNSDRMTNLSFKILEHVDDVTRTKQEHECKVQRMTKSIKSENSTFDTVNDSKHNFLDKNQDNTIDASIILTQLQDPVRITARRAQYPKWCLSISHISESLSNENTQSDYKVFHNVASDEASNARLIVNNLERFTNAGNLLSNRFESHNSSIYKYSDDTDKKVERSVFLKPGKCWTRSLSILNNINDELNLEKLSVGKGKKWRQSVREILDMQKQGIFQSCLKKDKDDTNLSYSRHDATNISSSFDGDKYKECSISGVHSANHVRFSKRISVRVIPNNASIKCEVKDAPFLEAFGMTAKKSSSLQSSHRRKSSTDDNQPIKRYSTTARDVVLQKCLQNCYLVFSDCFPDTFLDHCRKIGEGVYGEVFLHEHNNRKSVIKIIPIEGETLVNGERQKKFNEILSEIVIAKELDNLRLNPMYRTSGFVEVKSIKCIIGSYPKKLVELWNVYDDDKRSDNDCPSMFGENQLYITLELSHGGEDLEAFVFQTAKEACALFLQIALTLAVAEKALEFEHRDLHWGNILISRTKEPYIFYNLNGKEIKVPSNGVKMSIIDFTLSRMLYQGCCIYNDLALDPALFSAHGEYQFEIYRLMRDKIQNNWQKFEPYTNVLWLHYILDKMITAVRYKRKNLKMHKCAIMRLKEFKNTMLNYDSAFDFVTNSDSIVL
ncbi:uncharacterized protein Haspin isoform X2 [Linepithema humile]|uniref:uncharacterized protein Haspin isoform X2 n=1 Tax=Linepithema humile TaxID=83485 RepID=UPI000623AC17|nr:PREDICTED: uncharacterized protein LOC105677359 isoform X1 [Linepithema humile]XP_012231357.1 PREDICTED: uncharacterized protein LOC105677359 isoform X1 [Linepithema humile]